MTIERLPSAPRADSDGETFRVLVPSAEDDSIITIEARQAMTKGKEATAAWSRRVAALGTLEQIQRLPSRR